MSSRKSPKLPNTLSFRLTLWYAGIFAVSSCVAFLLFYVLVSAVIRDRADQELLGQVSRFSAVLASAGAEEVANAAVIEAQAAGVRKVFFRLLYPTGEVFSSSSMSYWQDIGVRSDAVEKLLRGRGPVIETVVVPDRKEKVRVLYAPLSPSILLQVGQAMENDSRFLGAFKAIFILTMAFLILLAAGVGWFMARRAMSGVEAVTRTARKIAEGTLDERVPVKARGDEVDQLASTFNQMLDRIRALLTGMKEMSDNIAHDLRSPVARIRGMAEVTLTEGRSGADFEGMAASTVEECDRLLDLINTMLVISKTESGVAELSLAEIDLAGLVRSACDLFSAPAEDRGIALRCDAAQPLVLLGDRRLIQRMLSNLLDNALKYTPAGGTVAVSASETGDGQVVLSVRDTGMGISAEDLPRVFERFYRGDRSRSQSGIGLGLSLARAIPRDRQVQETHGNLLRKRADRPQVWPARREALAPVIGAKVIEATTAAPRGQRFAGLGEVADGRCGGNLASRRQPRRRPMIPIQEFHPMFVHFPLVFLLSAVALDIVVAPSGDLAGRGCVSNVALCSLLLGAAGAAVAAVFGDMAFDVARARGFPLAPLEAHEDLGLTTLIYFAVFALLRAAAWWRRIPLAGGRGWLVVSIGLVGVGLLLTTAYHGGRLVYHFGVNVEAVRP